MQSINTERDTKFYSQSHTRESTNINRETKLKMIIDAFYLIYIENSF